MSSDPFSDEQTRTLVNLEQRYQVWMEAQRDLSKLPYDLRRKTVGEYAYLYEIFDRSGNGKSLGRYDDSKDQQLKAYRERKAFLKGRSTSSARLLDESCRLYRTLRLPLLASEAGPILREADRRSLLGSHLMVVGTNAMPAYAVEAAAFIDAPTETDDFDIAWTKAEVDESSRPFWSMLKAVDPTYAQIGERPFQARNSRAYEVELLIAPSRESGFFKSDLPRPTPLPEQEWLLRGKPVDRVVACRDASPARILAPDPRRFALHKLWMSHKPERSSLKKAKDHQQGIALLDTIASAMSHYPLNEEFEAELPDELKVHFEQWKMARSHVNVKPSWA